VPTVEPQAGGPERLSCAPRKRLSTYWPEERDAEALNSLVRPSPAPSAPRRQPGARLDGIPWRWTSAFPMMMSTAAARSGASLGSNMVDIPSASPSPTSLLESPTMTERARSMSGHRRWASKTMPVFGLRQVHVPLLCGQ